MYDVFVIGCGGIGGYVLDMLPQVMACHNLDRLSSEQQSRVLQGEGIEANTLDNAFNSLQLIDGDTFSGHNALRQEATRGSKLVVQMNKIRKKDAFTTWLNTTKLIGHRTYLTPDNMWDIIGGAVPKIIFLCVDNHKTRYELSKYMEENLSTCLLINGGNKKITGNVNVWARSGGVDYDPPIYKIYPEITDKYDLRPDEVDCATVAPNNDQTAITNSMIANVMLAMFRKAVSKGFKDGFNQKLRQKDTNGNNKVVRKNEVLIDFDTMSMTAISHKATEDNRPRQTQQEELSELEGAENINEEELN